MYKKIDIKELFSLQYKNNQFARYDIVLRYLFIEKFYSKNKKDDFIYKPYIKLLKARDRNYRTKDFINIIKSFEKHGYVEQFPIVLDKQKTIRNGGHRLACCLWFGTNEIPYRINENKKGRRIFTKEWMVEHGFKKYMSELKTTKKKLEL